MILFLFHPHRTKRDHGHILLEVNLNSLEPIMNRCSTLHEGLQFLAWQIFLYV